MLKVKASPLIPPAPPPPAAGSDQSDPLLSCLSIVAGLLGRPVSTVVLKAGLPMGKEAVSPSLCLRAAESAGMRARIFSRPELAGISSLTLPCLLLLKDQTACVLTRRSGEEAEIISPELPDARRTLALSALQAEYSGYAILVQLQGRLDQRAGDLRLVDTKEWFWGTLLRFLPIYKHVLLATLLVNLLTIVGPLFIMNVYDRVVPNSAFDTLWALAIGVLIAYLFDFLLRNLRGYFVDVAGRNADVIIASRLMQQLTSMRLDHKPDSTGSLANNLREFESLREFFSSSTLLAFADIPFIFIFIAIIGYIAGPLALAPVVAVPLVILAGYLLQYPFQRVIEKGFKESSQKNALLVEVINGLETIKTSQAEGRIQKRWEETIGMSSESTARAKSLATFSISMSLFASQLVSIIVIVGGVYLIADGKLTMGGLIACSILVSRSMAPLGAVAAMLTRFQQSRMALKALDLLMRIPGERSAGQNFVRADAIEPSLTLEQVSFQYPGTPTLALRTVGLHIGKGEKVGVIGRTGSGKSTLGRLCLGLYQPQQGALKMGGIDIRQMHVSDLRSRIGYVSQDNYLFYGTIRDNIAFGAPHASEQAILRAAGLAGVTDFVRTHPAGFDWQVGERGMSLSGGQRQAVAIARALLLDPPLLILDEPTSSMDNASELALKQRLEAYVRDKTLLLFTHRHSMLSLVDRLVVMDGGRILADGPKDKVLEALQKGQIAGARR